MVGASAGTRIVAAWPETGSVITNVTPNASVKVFMRAAECEAHALPHPDILPMLADRLRTELDGKVHFWSFALGCVHVARNWGSGPPSASCRSGLRHRELGRRARPAAAAQSERGRDRGRP